MKTKLNAFDIVCWFFGLILLVIGIMNLFMVHPIPGIIYILVSILYFPPTNTFFKKTAYFTILFKVKLIFFILIMWATLGIGDLAEMYGL